MSQVNLVPAPARQNSNEQVAAPVPGDSNDLRGVSIIQSGNAASKRAKYEEALKQKEFKARQGSIGGDMDNIDKYNKTKEEEDLDFRTGKKWRRNSRGSLVEEAQDRASELIDKSIYREGFVLPQFLRNLFGITLPDRGSSVLSGGSARSDSAFVGPSSVGASTRTSMDSRTTVGSNFSEEGAGEPEPVTMLFKILLLPAFLLAELIEAPFVFMQNYPLITFAVAIIAGMLGTDKVTERALVPYRAVFGPGEAPAWYSASEESAWGTPGLFFGPELPSLNPLGFAYGPLNADAAALVPWVSNKPASYAFATDYDDKGFLDFSGPNSVTDIMFRWIYEREMIIAGRMAKWLGN